MEPNDIRLLLVLRKFFSDFKTDSYSAANIASNNKVSMENYVYKNPYVLSEEQMNSIKAKKQHNESTVALPAPIIIPKGKEEVTKAIPEKLRAAIEGLELTRIMQDKAMKLVCLLFQRGMQEYRDMAVFIPLPVKYLEEVFGSYYHKDFFNLLKENNIIECNEEYRQGSKAYPGYSKGYRINKELLKGEYAKVSYLERSNAINSNDLKIKRTYFPNGIPEKNEEGKSQCYVKGTSESLSVKTDHDDHSDNCAPTLCSSPASSLHISTEVFKKSQIFDDLRVLKYNQSRLFHQTHQQTSMISTEFFRNSPVISTGPFEVHNNLTGKRYYTTKEKAAEWIRSYGGTLFSDGKKIYIDRLEDYAAKKIGYVTYNYEWQIYRLVNEIFYADRNPTNGRLDHNLTCTPRQLLQVIKEDNGLIEIDLCNSQFAIHAYWMKQEGLIGDHPDVTRYYDLCANGRLYEGLGEELSFSRDLAKQTMMEIAFSAHSSRSDIKSRFGKAFPNVAAHIEGFKRSIGDSSKFAVELQQLESEIFIDNLYPLIKDEGYFCLPKHDSLIIRGEDKEQIMAYMQRYFNWLQFECTVDVGGTRVQIRND